MTEVLHTDVLASPTATGPQEHRTPTGSGIRALRELDSPYHKDRERLPSQAFRASLPTDLSDLWALLVEEALIPGTPFDELARTKNQKPLSAGQTLSYALQGASRGAWGQTIKPTWFLENLPAQTGEQIPIRTLVQTITTAPQSEIRTNDHRAMGAVRGALARFLRANREDLDIRLQPQEGEVGLLHHPIGSAITAAELPFMRRMAEKDVDDEINWKIIGTIRIPGTTLIITVFRDSESPQTAQYGFKIHNIQETQSAAEGTEGGVTIGTVGFVNLKDALARYQQTGEDTLSTATACGPTRSLGGAVRNAIQTAVSSYIAVGEGTISQESSLARILTERGAVDHQLLAAALSTQLRATVALDATDEATDPGRDSNPVGLRKIKVGQVRARLAQTIATDRSKPKSRPTSRVTITTIATAERVPMITLFLDTDGTYKMEVSIENDTGTTTYTIPVLEREE